MNIGLIYTYEFAQSAEDNKIKKLYGDCYVIRKPCKKGL